MPAIDDQSKTAPDAMDDQPQRRGFLIATIGLLAGAPLLTGLFTALRVMLAPAGGATPIRQELCKLFEVPTSGLLERTVSYRQRRGPAVETISRTVFLTRDAGTVIALSNRCTHLGCAVRHDPESVQAPLVCPCHDGLFSATGDVIGGPPTRPLQRFALEIPEEPEGIVYLVE